MIKWPVHKLLSEQFFFIVCRLEPAIMSRPLFLHITHRYGEECMCRNDRKSVRQLYVL